MSFQQGSGESKPDRAEGKSDQSPAGDLQDTCSYIMPGNVKVRGRAEQEEKKFGPDNHNHQERCSQYEGYRFFMQAAGSSSSIPKFSRLPTLSRFNR
jgi:hypothetical protein